MEWTTVWLIVAATYMALTVLYVVLEDSRPRLHWSSFEGGELLFVLGGLVMAIILVPLEWLYYLLRGLFKPVDPHRFHTVCSQYGTTAHRLIGPVFLCHDTQARWIKRWFFVRVKL